MGLTVIAVGLGGSRLQGAEPAFQGKDSALETLGRFEI